MTLSDRQQIFAHNVGLLLIHIGDLGYKVTLGEALRTQEQADIYAKQGKGIIHSLHMKRLAIDINIFDHQNKFLTAKEDIAPFGEYWEKLNKLNRWGGHFHERPDADHFEMQDI